MPRLVTDLFLCLLLSGVTLTTACDLPTILTCLNSLGDLLDNDGDDGKLETMCQSIGPVNECASSLAETCVSDEDLKKKMDKLTAGADMLDAVCKLHSQGFDQAGCKASDIQGCILPVVEELVSVTPSNPFKDPPCKALIPVGKACLEGIKDSCDDGYAKNVTQFMLGFYTVLNPDCDIEGKNPNQLPSEPSTSKGDTSTDDKDGNSSTDGKDGNSFTDGKDGNSAGLALPSLPVSGFLPLVIAAIVAKLSK